MGKYSSTCLALGGCNEHSAAAVMLDVNKQVVYARNEKGAVIARQLLAISEERKLVAFRVYPETLPDEVKFLFLDYDLQLAEALRIPLFDPEKEEKYTISKIIARSWYDDGLGILIEWLRLLASRMVAAEVARWFSNTLRHQGRSIPFQRTGNADRGHSGCASERCGRR